MDSGGGGGKRGRSNARGKSSRGRGRGRGRGGGKVRGGAAGPGRSRKGGPAPTVEEILEDPLTELSRKHWAQKLGEESVDTKFDPSVVEEIYKAHLGGGQCMFPASKLMLLEFSGYLEHYLWKHFDPVHSSFAHVMSILLMVNEKAREDVSLWSAFESDSAMFPAFMLRVLGLSTERPLEPVRFHSGDSTGKEDQYASEVAGDDPGTPPPAMGAGQEEEEPAGLHDEAEDDKKGSSESEEESDSDDEEDGEDEDEDDDDEDDEAGTDDVSHRSTMTFAEGTALLHFLIHAFQSLENDLVRPCVLRLVSLPLWKSMTPAHLALQLRLYPQLERHWSALQRQPTPAAPRLFPSFRDGKEKDDGEEPASKRARTSAKKKTTKRSAKAGSSPGDENDPLHPDALEKRQRYYDATFFPAMLQDFWSVLTAICQAGKESQAQSVSGFSRMWVERFLEWLLDMQSQIPTRRFTRAFLLDQHVLERVQVSGMCDGERFRLVRQLTERLDDLLHFAVDDQTGMPLSDAEVRARHYTRLQILQRYLYRHHPEQLKEVALGAVSSIATPPKLRGYLDQLSTAELVHMARRLALLPATAKPLEEDSSQPSESAPTNNGPHASSSRKRPRQDSDDGGRKSLPSARGLVMEPSGFDRPAFLASGLSLERPSREAVLSILLEWHSRRQSPIAAVNALPLYPAEDLLWDPHRVPFDRTRQQHDAVLALPKLNLQFLTFHDYLLRSFHLYRLESTYEIRQDLVDAIRRCQPRRVTGFNAQGYAEVHTRFDGWSRRAVTLPRETASPFNIVQVKSPKIGEDHPAEVLAEVTYDIGRYAPHIQAEWNRLREHDVVFLATVEPPESLPTTPSQHWTDEDDPTFAHRFGVRVVRGAEVVSQRDAKGVAYNDPFASEPGQPLPEPEGTQRTLTLRMDPGQYHLDMQTELLTAAGAGSDKEELVGPMMYERFNLLVRRDAKENNFKAVLETMRDVMNVAAVGKAVPPWLRDVFLGYGDAAAAHYRNLPNRLDELDFHDTFLDGAHAKNCFPDCQVVCEDETGQPVEDPATLARPFRARFEPLEDQAEANQTAPSRASASASGKGGKSAKRRRGASKAEAEEASGASPKKERVILRSYRPPRPGPYPEDEPRWNPVPFTPVQTEAIRSGMNPGLTMIVGPPGTGKTDVAVQIISNLYHAFPKERTLLVTHSNHALNDLFSKIMERDISEMHLLRLGRGERELDTEEDFSRGGRVQRILARRLQLLQEVERLARTLGLGDEVGYTCETADYFYLYHVQSKMEAFDARIRRERQAAEAETRSPDAAMVSREFPFKEYFKDVPGGLGGGATDVGQAGAPLFRGESLEDDREAAESCFRHLRRRFEELRKYRAFELLRSQRARTDFMLAKQARVVAMTCTHAALTRRHLVELGFKYDNIVMEEAAQIMEVETFIPMLLQNFDSVEDCRLKRVVLLGDHHQLPPVVQSRALQRYSRLDQSLFTRFVRLGTPVVQLNKQGRARPALAALYNWRYDDLGNLPVVEKGTDYRLANAGFAHEVQLVDVPDYQGRGETQPSPFFYQNLGEAEYVIAVFQYMRLLGYPAESISILTTYNGQKSLLHDVAQLRCAPYPQFGMPHRIDTVDKYQGQQNDYILLSLVRTRNVGHLRDVRRLVVAMSRARLGLYIFCRQRLFENCYELSPAFSQLLTRPPSLQLVPTERVPTSRPAASPAEHTVSVEGVEHMASIVQEMHHARQQEAFAQYQALSQQVSQVQGKEAATNEDAAAMEDDDTEKGNAKSKA